MGLNIPMDLDRWRSWQRRQNRLRQIRTLFRPPAEQGYLLGVRGENPELLVALDAVTPTQRMSLVSPLEHLDQRPVAVLVPTGVGAVDSLLPGAPWRWVPVDRLSVPEEVAGVTVVLAVGHYLESGSLAHSWANSLGARFNVVQHGLLTPHAPPLPPEAHLLAFSDADADFWQSDRTDITSETVGSQLLWTAGPESDTAAADLEARPVFFGQLHGAELPRSQFARAAQEFCRNTGAVYRPHPSETDRLSRLQHALWERKGITIDRSGQPLGSMTAPVASVFSTGILEAAARGLPSWATHPNPPVWLEEFWERYRMSKWGQDPTPAPERPDIEPARAIALAIERQLGGSA